MQNVDCTSIVPVISKQWKMFLVIVAHVNAIIVHSLFYVHLIET